MANEIDYKGWTRHPRFAPLEAAIQREADSYSYKRSEGSKDDKEWWRGMTDAMVRAKGMAGYFGTLTKREEAELVEVMADRACEIGVCLRLLQLDGWVADGAKVEEEFPHGGWARHPRFVPLIDALQEEANRSAQELRDWPLDHTQYRRGYTEGMVQARGMAGYWAQLSATEEAEMKAILADPASREGAAGRLLVLDGWIAVGQEVDGLLGKVELEEAEGRLARGEVGEAEEVRAAQVERFAGQEV